MRARQLVDTLLSMFFGGLGGLGVGDGGAVASCESTKVSWFHLRIALYVLLPPPKARRWHLGSFDAYPRAPAFTPIPELLPS